MRLKIKMKVLAQWFMGIEYGQHAHGNLWCQGRVLLFSEVGICNRAGAPGVPVMHPGGYGVPAVLWL